MTIWIDANISPAIARFISDSFGIACFHIGSLPVDIADDEAIFNAAKKEADVIITTKDYDFVLLQDRLGAPLYSPLSAGTRFYVKINSVNRFPIAEYFYNIARLSAQLLIIKINHEKVLPLVCCCFFSGGFFCAMRY